MSGTIERALQSMQAQSTEEHLPLEDVLAALHSADYADRIFMNGVDTDGWRHEHGPYWSFCHYDDYWHRNPCR